MDYNSSMKYFFTLFISLNCLATTPLKLKEIKFLDNNLEISGLTKNNKNEMVIISDNNEDQYVYKVVPKDKKTFTTKVEYNFSDLNGFYLYYYSSLIGYHANRWIKSPWDLEGIYSCGNTHYVVNEQVRHVLKINLDKMKLEHLKLDLTQAFKDIGTPLEKISNNAGFEGLALDCNQNILYIAQERDPRAIIIYDLKNNSYQGIIQTKPNSKTQISPDYSDLYYQNGYLYALERNEWNILKIDLKTKKVVENFTFDENSFLNLRKVYKTGKPYGLAEALYIEKDQNYYWHR
jgi:hypothetical protein